MKNKATQIIKTVLVVGTIFGFVGIASAYSTWTPPTGTAPGSNVDAPINVGATSQGKAGPLGVGEAAISAPGTSAGLSFESNGAAAVNGFTNWGASFFDGNVTVSPGHTFTVNGSPVCNAAGENCPPSTGGGIAPSIPVYVLPTSCGGDGTTVFIGLPPQHAGSAWEYGGSSGDQDSCKTLVGYLVTTTP